MAPPSSRASHATLTNSQSPLENSFTPAVIGSSSDIVGPLPLHRTYLWSAQLTVKMLNHHLSNLFIKYVSFLFPCIHRNIQICIKRHAALRIIQPGTNMKIKFKLKHFFYRDPFGTEKRTPLLAAETKRLSLVAGRNLFLSANDKSFAQPFEFCL